MKIKFKLKDLFVCCRGCGNKINLVKSKYNKIYCNEKCKSKVYRKIQAIGRYCSKGKKKTYNLADKIKQCYGITVFGVKCRRIGTYKIKGLYYCGRHTKKHRRNRNVYI